VPPPGERGGSLSLSLSLSALFLRSSGISGGENKITAAAAAEKMTRAAASRFLLQP